MDPIEIMKRPAPYASGHENAPAAAQLRAKRLCWEYKRSAVVKFCASCSAPATR